MNKSKKVWASSAKATEAKRCEGMKSFNRKDRKEGAKIAKKENQELTLSFSC